MARRPSITIRKVEGGYAVFKGGKRWTPPYTKQEANYAAKYMRESKYR